MSRIYKSGTGEFEPFAWEGAGNRPLPAPGVRPLLASETPGRNRKPNEPPSAPPPPPVDIEGVRKQAFQEGYQAGRESALEEAAAARAELEEGFARSVAAFADQKRALRNAVEREVVDLAFAVARRILRREIGVDPGATAGIVRSCLDEAGAHEVRVVRVHPDQVESVRAAAGPTVEVVPDADLEPGGAVLETDRGRLDARIDAQLDELEQGLADR